MSVVSSRAKGVGFTPAQLKMWFSLPKISTQVFMLDVQAEVSDTSRIEVVCGGDVSGQRERVCSREEEFMSVR